MPPVTAVPADEIHEKYLQKAISEINELGDEIVRAAGGAAIPVLGSGHPLADIDVFEVYNARLLRESFNDEALRFARKYNLTMGAGSDAHVLLGVGTGAVRMRAFTGPEEFLVSLQGAEILSRPKSLLAQQALKWAAQAKERVR